MKKVAVKLYKKMHAGAKKLGIKSQFIRNINRSIVKKLRSDHTVIQGHKMFLDKKDSLRLSTKTAYEPYVSELIAKSVKKGDTVIDLGAHIGYFTLLLARLVGPEGKVYAFEPHPTLFQLLKKNVEVNNYQNVILENKAVSNLTQKMKLYTDSTSTTKNSLNKTSYCTDNYVEIDCVKLDDYFSDTPNISFMKIDVEGHELNVLKGMKNILKNPKINIITEFTPEYFKEQDTSPSELPTFLINNGFEILSINELKKQLDPFNINDSSFSNLKERRIKNKNLFCVKNGKNT